MIIPSKGDFKMKILEIKKLNVKYSEHYALKNINININNHEYICLVGKNGSGKSTLLKTIAGLTKKDSGTINIFTDNRRCFISCSK